MMAQRAFRPDDHQRIIDLLVAYRVAGHTDRYPTVARLELLLESRVWDLERDVQVWEDERGALIACAALWKRRPDATTYALERIRHPDHPEPSALLDWAIERAAAGKARLAVMASDPDAMRLLECRGFAPLAEEHSIYMSIALDAPLDLPALADGWTIEPLRQDDLDQYRAAYGFATVNPAHQRALLKDPTYQHFVAKAPDATIAGYVECSFNKAEWARTYPRTGWLDYVQTQPDFQRRGLGRALMITAFNHLRAQGADRVMLITSSANEPARALYEKVGMTFAAAETVYLKECAP